MFFNEFFNSLKLDVTKYLSNKKFEVMQFNKSLPIWLYSPVVYFRPMKVFLKSV